MQLNLGETIQKLRRRDNRTQEELASALGVTSQAVSRWELGGSYPDMETIPSIANYFGISIDELFGYENDRNQKIADIIAKVDAYSIKTDGGDDWPFWCNPDYSQVEEEIKADPRWKMWVDKTKQR